MNKHSRKTEALEPQGEGIIDPSPNTLPIGKFLRKGEKAERRWHLYSLELAKALNPGQPDVASALLHFTIYTWQASNRLKQRSEAFRSIRQLEQEMPYLSKTAVQEAIGRLERAMVLVVDRSKDRLHFSIPEPVIKKYKYAVQARSGRHWLNIRLAKSHGILEALILGNMDWMMKHFTRPHATDAGRRPYYNLTPSHLAQYIPRKPRAIKAALEHLSGVIAEHPTKKWHYRVLPIPDSDEPEADTKCRNPYSDMSEPYTCELSDALEPASIKAQEAIGSAVDSSLDVKEDVKGVFKDYIERDPAPPPALPGSLPTPSLKLSPEAIKLMELVNEERRKPIKKLTPLDKLVKSADDVELSDAGNGEYDAGELHYEWIPRDIDGNILTGDYYVDDVIYGLKAGWDVSKFPYTNEEVEKLRKILLDNRYLTYEQIDELFEDLDCNTLYIGPGGIGYGDEIPTKKTKGWDTWYFHKKVKSLGAFIKYLPQLLREKIFTTCYEDGQIDVDVCGENDDIHKHFIYLYDYLCPNSRDLLDLRRNPLNEL